MKNIFFIAIILITTSASFARAVDADEEILEVMTAQEIEKRINNREKLEKIQGIENPKDPYANPQQVEFVPPTGDAVADLVARIVYMEEEMRRQNGQISQLQFELKNMSKQLAETAEIAKTANENSLKSASEQYVTRPGDVNDKYVIKVDGASAQDNNEEEAQNPEMSEEVDFNAAIAQISEQNLPAARKKFTEFVDSYPKSSRLADAYFWLAEINMDEQKYKQSALNYLKSYKADKQGKRAEEALLKSSTALGKLGKKEEACKNLSTLKNMNGLQDLIKEQANSEAIKLGCK